MSEVSEILAEIEECYSVVSNPNLVFSDKRNAYVDAGAILLPKIKALLESHAVIDEGASYALEKAANNAGSNIARDVIRLELNRLTTHHGT